VEKNETKTVIFSRPVKISDIDYEVQVPVGLTEEEEISWIMNNLDKVSRLSSSPEEYSLNNVDPKTWTEWSVEINPVLNSLKDEETDWLKWAIEIASEWHLEEEVKSCYHKHIAEGYSEEQSANMALYDWDI
jgi:hypothetical protein